MKVTAVFDIGKTNKKLFLFDEDYKEVYSEYIQFDEIKDEDGDPCDDLPAIQRWVKSTSSKILQSTEFDVCALNFSSYGASFVHIDKQGKVLAPLYNYVKEYPDHILDAFYKSYGPKLTIAKETASPPLQMLNSGLQLYYLKYAKPELYKQISWSLHLPQYLSYLFTNAPLSDYTSIGCHTMLWDYTHHRYHRWVYEEEIDKRLAPIKESDTSIHKSIEGKALKIGVGIHDSSAALIPYLKSTNTSFLLLSTGTWSISINPFSQEVLSEDDLQHDCLNFMQSSGEKVKASRLFLGNEYKIQIQKMNQFYQKEKSYHKQVKFDDKLYGKLRENFKHYYKWESISTGVRSATRSAFEQFKTFEEAYHQLMLELIELQIYSLKQAMGQTAITKLYVDGGFADNEIFMQLLGKHFQNMTIHASATPMGSALGAALVISDEKPRHNFFKKTYNLVNR